MLPFVQFYVQHIEFVFFDVYMEPRRSFLLNSNRQQKSSPMSWAKSEPFGLSSAYPSFCIITFSLMMTEYYRYVLRSSLLMYQY